MKLPNWLQNLFSEDSRLKDDLLSVNVKEVTLPSGKKAYLRALSADILMSKQDKGNFTEEDYFELVSQSVCNRRGKLLLTTNDVRKMDFALLNFFAIEVIDLNNVNPDAVEKAKEELKKVQTEGFSTNSV